MAIPLPRGRLPVHVRHHFNSYNVTSYNYLQSRDKFGRFVFRTQRLRNIPRRRPPNITLRPQSAPDVSIPGFGKIFTNEYSIFGKIVWGLAIALCFIICCAQIGLLVSKYLEYPVDVKIDIVRNITIRFPAVTVCPFYPMTFKNGMHELRVQYASINGISYASISQLLEQVRDMDLLSLPNITTTILWNVSRFGSVKVVGLCSQNFISNCHSESRLISRDLETYWGTCTTHWFEKNLKHDGTHKGFGITLDDYELFPNAPTNWTTSVLIHDKDDLPRHKIYLELGQTVLTKFETILGFTVKQYHRLNTRTNPCRSQLEVKKCIWRCIEDNISDKVKCRLPFMLSARLPNCTTAAEAIRTQTAARQVYKKWGGGDLCTSCPRKCEENIYSVIPNVVYPTEATHLKIVLLDNLLDVITEQPSISINVLVSDIGGNLGLFLGVCILTGFQILEIIVVRIYAWLFRGKSSRTEANSI